MKIHIHELSDLESEFDFTHEEPWVLDAIQSLDEATPEESARPAAVNAKANKPRTARVHYSLRKVDDVVVAHGEAETSIQLLCSRCANPFKLEANLKFAALFCQDPEMAGIAHLKDKKPTGQNKGFARHAHDFRADKGDQSLLQDLDITYLSDEYINLKDVLIEQLQLQIPFQPLCHEGCKGMCSNCGADLNVGRCACAKVTRSNPFAVLRDMKVYAKSDS